MVGRGQPAAVDRLGREASALTQAGHEVETRHVGSTMVPLVLRPLAEVAGRAEILRVAWRSRPDVIHVFGPILSLLVPLLRRVTGGLVVYESEDGSIGTPKGRLSRPRARIAERTLGRRAALVIVGSPGSGRELRDRLGLRYVPVTLLDIPGTASKDVVPANLRERLRLGNRTLVVRAGPELPRAVKATLVEALAATPDVHMGFLGADAWRDQDEMRLLSERLHVSGRVHFLRDAPEGRLFDYLAEADAAVFVDDHSSLDRTRTLPAEALGCLAAGTAVISLDLSELGAFVTETGAGWSIGATDREALGECLSTLRGNQRLGPVETTWPWEAAKLVQVYARLPELASYGHASSGSSNSTLTRTRAVISAIRDVLNRHTLRHPRAAILYARGRRLRGSGRFEKAADLLRVAADLDPSQHTYALHAAAALKDAGRDDEAASAYRALFDSTGRQASATAVAAAVAFAQLGRRRDAETILRIFQRVDQRSPAIWARIAEIEAALGRVDKATKAAREVGNDAAPGLVRIRTRALEQSGEPSAAVDSARAAGLADVEERLAGTLRSLDPGWRPLPESRDRRRPDRAVPGGRPRVLNLLETSLPHVTAGYAHRSRSVIAAQTRAGFDPAVATRLGFPANRRLTNFAPVESIDGVPHHRFVLPGVHRYSAVPVDRLVQRNAELAAALAEDFQPSVIQAATPHVNCLVALGIRAVLGFPVVYDVRGFPEMTWAVRSGGDETEIYRLRRAAETQCMSDADLVTTLSDVMRTQIVERGVDADKVAVLPHAVDVDVFSPGPRPAALATRYGIEGKIVIGCVTSLLEYEGIDTVLRAMVRLRRDKRDVVALIVGDGAARPGLERLATELGLEGVVVFAGRVPHHEIREHYRLLDAFLLPRRDLEVCKYVTPLKPFEAMSSGIPLICSDLPVLREVVGDDERGWAFPAEDADALAEVIAACVDDEAGRGEAARLARRLVTAGHSSAALDQAVSAALRSVTAAAEASPAISAGV